MSTSTMLNVSEPLDRADRRTRFRSSPVPFLPAGCRMRSNPCGLGVQGKVATATAAMPAQHRNSARAAVYGLCLASFPWLSTLAPCGWQSSPDWKCRRGTGRIGGWHSPNTPSCAPTRVHCVGTARHRSVANLGRRAHPGDPISRASRDRSLPGPTSMVERRLQSHCPYCAEPALGARPCASAAYRHQ